MEHLLAKATTVAEELGTFKAIASAWDADREDDMIARDAFDQTLSDWKGSNKNLPLLWEHGSEVVGFVDPDEMHTDERGLIIGGEIDRETDRGKQAWKMVKSRVAGFSIGFASESRPRKGGGRLLASIDLLEISVTSRPMHPSTRALSWKSATATETLSEDELRERSLAAVAATLAGTRPRRRQGRSTTEEKDAIVERSRAEYQAARAKEAEEARAAERGAGPQGRGCRGDHPHPPDAPPAGAGSGRGFARLGSQLATTAEPERDCPRRGGRGEDAAAGRRAPPRAGG